MRTIWIVHAPKVEGPVISYASDIEAARWAAEESKAALEIGH